MENLIFSTVFQKNLKCQISSTSVRWDPNRFMQMRVKTVVVYGNNYLHIER